MNYCGFARQVCPNLVYSQAVNFDGTNLLINLPAGSYANNRRLCFVVIQSIPTTTTINAPVFITIGTGTEQYPMVRCDCAQATACSIRTRTKYSACVETTATGGSFRLLNRVCCAPNNNLAAINGTAPTA